MVGSLRIGNRKAAYFFGLLLTPARFSGLLVSHQPKEPIMQTKTGHIIGATYYSKVWNMTYQVMCAVDTTLAFDYMDGVKILWEDGHITERTGPVYDRLVKEPQYTCQY